MVVHLLNQYAAQKLTPAEIVLRLRNNGWINGPDMPENVWAEWRGSGLPVAICIWDDYRSEYRLCGSDFEARTWTLHNVHSNLSNYLFMLTKDYISNNRLLPEKPSCSTI